MPKITKRIVDALRPEPGRDVFAWDSELRGFGVRVKPSGAKAFLIQYRNQHGSTRRMVVGRVGTLTPDQARAIARDRLTEATKGGDPSAERRAAREALTVAAVCDWYLKEATAGRILGRRGRPIKASTLTHDRGRIEAHVKPLIGNRAVASLSVTDLERMQADIAAGKTARKPDPDKRPHGSVARGGSAIAGRTLGMVRTIFAHAVHARLIPSNPATGARQMKGGRRMVRLSLEQLAALGEAMRADGENPTGVAAIRVLALTGFRCSEALGIKKSWVLDTGGVLFPDTKSDAQARPIGKAAVAALKAQRKAAGEGTEWLLPADRGNGHFAGIRLVIDRVGKRAGLTGITPHVFRHTFASVAGDLGHSELVIKGLLGHASGSVAAGYVHLDRALVTAADRVSEAIAAALDGRSGEVVELEDARQGTRCG